MRQLYKIPLFLLGFSFITLLVASSFLYSSYLVDRTKIQQQLLYDKAGKLIGSAPFPPSTHFPLGTDYTGYNMLYIIIDGAKYTIGICLLIAFFRIVLALGIGLIKGSNDRKMKSGTSGILDAFQYVPMTLLAYFILKPVVLNNPEFSSAQIIYFQIFLLTILAMPSVTVLIGNEVKLILKNEFIRCATVLGGNKLHILIKHVLPHLYPRLFIIYFQQVIQVLLVIMHLGLFHLYIGGTLIETGFDGELIYYSMSNEWSGLIGKYFRDIKSTPWVPLFIILFFALTVLAFTFILEGLKRSLLNEKENVYNLKKSWKRRNNKSSGRKTGINGSMFEFKNNS